MSTGSHKRANSTTDTASSLAKKHKSPMVKCMKDMIHTLQAGSSKDLEVAKQIQDHIAFKKEMAQEKVDAEIERCLELQKSVVHLKSWRSSMLPLDSLQIGITERSL